MSTIIDLPNGSTFDTTKKWWEQSLEAQEWGNTVLETVEPTVELEANKRITKATFIVDDITMTVEHIYRFPVDHRAFETRKEYIVTLSENGQ